MTTTSSVEEKRTFRREWRRKRGIWHLYLGESDSSECRSHTRPVNKDGQVVQHTDRQHGVRKATPESNERLCDSCARSIGMRRRKTRAASSRLVTIRQQLKDAMRGVDIELDLIAIAAPALLKAARRATGLMTCRLEPVCEEPVRCPRCLAREKLADEIKNYSSGTAALD